MKTSSERSRDSREDAINSPLEQDDSLDSISDTYEGVNTLDACSSSGHPSVHNRSEHILTGCHPDPNTYADFGASSPTGRTAIGFGADEMAMFFPTRHQGHYEASQSRHGVAMSAHDPASCSHVERAVPSLQSYNYGADLDYRSSHARDFTSRPVEQSPFTNMTALESSIDTNLDYTRSPQQTPVSPASAVSPQQAYPRPDSRSKYTLVLDQLQPEDLSMVLEPLARSGVNVRAQLYNNHD